MNFSQAGTVGGMWTRVFPRWRREGQACDCAVQKGDAAARDEDPEALGGVEAVSVWWAAGCY